MIPPFIAFSGSYHDKSELITITRLTLKTHCLMVKRGIDADMAHEWITNPNLRHWLLHHKSLTAHPIRQCDVFFTLACKLTAGRLTFNRTVRLRQATLAVPFSSVRHFFSRVRNSLPLEEDAEPRHAMKTT